MGAVHIVNCKTCQAGQSWCAENLFLRKQKKRTGCSLCRSRFADKKNPRWKVSLCKKGKEELFPVFTKLSSVKSFRKSAKIPLRLCLTKSLKKRGVIKSGTSHHWKSNRFTCLRKPWRGVSFDYRLQLKRAMPHATLFSSINFFQPLLVVIPLCLSLLFYV